MQRTAPPTPLAPGLGLHRFRGDIQGLRTVAVLAVLLFHAGVTAIPGGFVGVDVFFVISGFLITGLLLKEVDRTGRLDLVEFYTRRVRRILPVALTVIVMTLAAGLVVYSSSEWYRLGLTSLAAVFSVVNWFFAAESTDYFAQEEAPSPLQHYWSLAVEEQFYLVWPLLIVVATVGLAGLRSRSGIGSQRSASTSAGAARRVVLLAGGVGAASLVHSVMFSPAEPGAAYFVTTTRVWELAVGAGLAAGLVIMPVIPAVVRGMLGWIGLGLIAASLGVISGHMPYPGVAALIPSGGSALVILAGAHEDGSTRWHPARLLATRPMQWVGDLSYSLYLVHWPLLSMAAWRSPEGRLPLTVGLGLAVASVGFAWVLRRYIEIPAMKGPLLGGRRQSLARGAVGMAATAAAGAAVLGLGLNATQGGEEGDSPVAGASAVHEGVDPIAELPHVSRVVPDPAAAHKDRARAAVDGCQQNDAAREPILCHYGDEGSDTVVVLAGDSHAAHWSSALIPAAEKNGWHVVTALKSACPVTTATVVRTGDGGGRPYSECDAWNDALPGALTDVQPDLILVSSARYDVAGGTSVVDGLADAWKTLHDRTGSAVGVIMDPPGAKTNVPKCLERHPNDYGACTSPKEAGVGTSGTPNLTQALERSPGVARIDLTDRICPGPVCAPVVGGAVVYSDSNHLTGTFGRTLAPYLEGEIVRLLP